MAVRTFLQSAEVARTFTITTLLAVFGATAITGLTSPVTHGTIIAVLCAAALVILVARRDELTPLRIAPSSLIAFIALAVVSTAWSTNPRHTFGASATMIAYAVLAITVGHFRDTLQTVRALGLVSRILLSISLAVEVLSGVLLDLPITFLGVQGNLATAGSIQGIFGTRNMLGFFAVIALITFVIEWRTLSISPTLAMLSISLASGMGFSSSSPAVLVLVVCVGVASLALTIVRHTRAARRGPVQLVLGGAVLATLGLCVAFRHEIIRWMGAGTDFSSRADLWNLMLDFIDAHRLFGWGWFGSWVRGEYPYTYINYRLDERHASGLNAYFDVTLQLGVVGLTLFLTLGGVALIRSWLTASTRYSVLYAWTPLILVSLAVESMFESFTLVTGGWFLLVLCALRAGQSRSWRENIDATRTGTTPTVGPR